jgi:hypothetical protein
MVGVWLVVKVPYRASETCVAVVVKIFVGAGNDPVGFGGLVGPAGVLRLGVGVLRL